MTCFFFLSRNLWAIALSKADGARDNKRWEDLPKGITFPITDGRKILLERFQSECYVLSIADQYDVFLPSRFHYFLIFICTQVAHDFLATAIHTN